MESGEVKRVGRARLRPRRICADKGYAKGVVRRYLRRLGIRITIARRSNEHRGGAFDGEIYRTRNLIERLIIRLKLDSTASPCLEFCAYLSRLGRADERTRTADLISLRVCGQGLLRVTRVCKSRIDKGFLVPSIARDCRVLRPG
jgi:hypothetical protein